MPASRRVTAFAHVDSVLKRGTWTPVRFETIGAADPTVTSGDVESVLHDPNGGSPFWRVTLRHTARLVDTQTHFHCDVNGIAAAFNGAAQVIRNGITGAGLGAITNPTTQFDVQLLVAGVVVDTAGASIEIVLLHDGR